MCENIYTYTLIAHKGGMTNAFCAYTLLENLTDDCTRINIQRFTEGSLQQTFVKLHLNMLMLMTRQT